MSWADAVGDGASESRRPTRVSYVPPHLRNKNLSSSDSSSIPSSIDSSPGFHLNRSGSREFGKPGRGRWRDRRRGGNEPNPSEKFAELEISEEEENHGAINFDAYEDIPVETSGSDVPRPVNTFAEIDLGAGLNENIRRCKYVKPTPVQRHAIPIVMAGRDLMACAQTGSGKTAAFCFPIINGIMRNQLPQRRGARTAYPLALILSPTRELSCQIHEEAKKFSNQTGVKVVVTYGGAPFNHQCYLIFPFVELFCYSLGDDHILSSVSISLHLSKSISFISHLRDLERGVDILVATPGRLVDMIERGRISLRMIKYLALDEADRMLDMGFEPQIRKIVEQMDMPPPGVRQTMLFSATFPNEIQRLASDFLSNYIFLAVGRVGSSTDLITQRVEFVQDGDKRSYLMDLLYAQRADGTHGKQSLTLVFVETKRGADALEHCLSMNGFPATAIHGDKMQMLIQYCFCNYAAALDGLATSVLGETVGALLDAQPGLIQTGIIQSTYLEWEREQALRAFKSGAIPIMVATDVAARGLDVPHVAHVINFDLPKDIDDYVHRIGRTGRAGNSGLATAFFNEGNQSLAKALAELMLEANQEVPPWLSRYAERSSYGGGSRGRRYGGGRFGGHDYRRDAPSRGGNYYHSNPYSGGGGGGSSASGGYATAPHGYGYGHGPVAASGWD
ncbi:hypothetical protein HHK36_031737 [Tetracentron sinense]|uniref:RNA helicase n=1 Tax=Tetracentron sinense TaxID=13715 RepID=A0A835D152_TETSI|nr:hypothetical protein HHK36_031737 [Tetracentron sinense]